MAIRTNPSYTTAHENLGDVYAKLASQAYGKALQLDANNAAVPPKLALIRELFNPATSKGQRPASTLSTPAPVAPPPVAAPAKPAPEPVASKPATPAVPAANATPAQTATAAAAPAAQPKAEPASGTDARKDVETAVRNWAKAWAARDMKGYLSAYGRDFDTPGGVKRSAWEEERRQRITGKSKITVTVSNLNITVNGSKATAKFRQDYKANELAVSSRKVLELTKTGDRWLIVRESVGN
jgi:ketosteroid isomerase-like protein